jgi:nitroreductase
MEALAAIKNRRSVRAFETRPVSRDDLEQLVDCARFAPTARNVQPWEFIAVIDKGTLEKLGSLIENGRFLSQSPACIAIICEDSKYYLEDGCAATENVLLAATGLGLASCWVAGDKKDYVQDVKGLLGVPEKFKLVSIIALGYSQVKPSAPAKRAVKEVLHWEKF